eukprot:IDg2949t1
MQRCRARKAAVLAVLQAADVLMDVTSEILICLGMVRMTSASTQAIARVISKRKGGIAGRSWLRVRNDPAWLFRFAMHPDYRHTSDWCAMFRISFELFERLSNELRPQIQKSTNPFRVPLPAEKYGHILRLPVSMSEIASVMNGFEAIAGLPYCVGAIDGTHIPWKKCPKSQHYEYRCYKGFESIVVLALSTAGRRIIYADVGNPGVHSDSTIFDRSRLKGLLSSGKWCCPDFPSLLIGIIEVRPYIMGDGAFKLSPSVMKTCSKDEIAANPHLAEWEKRASATRKPVECAFGILKNRFSTLLHGLMFEHEDDAVFFITACIILHNLCLESGDNGDDFLVNDGNEVVATNTSSRLTGKVVRDALLQYALQNRD